jgi:D-alanyl-D-alanine carboxypeptidase (penicillin-binding protein 5/6)
VEKFKKFVLSFLFMFFLLSNNIFASESEINLDKNKIGALGAILIDAKTGRVLWEKDSDKKLAMASTTKIMTAIIALENSKPDDIVTVSKSVLTVPKVKMNLEPNEKIKMKDLLYALMLESANDAAVTIAEHISGSVQNFCKLMTQKAKSIGAFNTLFETPNGLDKGDHHSTAHDMALIARYALNNKKFVEIINTPSICFATDKKSYSFINKNRLLHEFKGANGIKTGFTGKAGHCFVGAAKRNDMQLISVVLGSGWGARGKEGKWSDTKKILNYGFDNYKYENLIDKNSVAENLKVCHANKNENSVNLVYEKDLILDKIYNLF